MYMQIQIDLRACLAKYFLKSKVKKNKTKQTKDQNMTMPLLHTVYATLTASSKLLGR